jgi:hypothetical protein
MTVVKRFCFFHHAILRDRPNNLTTPPLLVITPGRRRRNRDPVLPLNQTRHGLPRPEVERHRQLVRHLADDQRTNPRCLPGVQSPASRTSAPFARFQRAQSAFSRKPHPFAYRTQTYAKGRRRRGLRHSATHRFHHQLSQVGLRGSIQLPGISFRTHARLTHYALFGAQVSMSKSVRRPSAGNFRLRQT